MSKSDVFHLGLTKNDLQGATLAIVPGDPDRVEKIAALMDKPVKLTSHREFTTWRAELDGKPVIVCSTVSAARLPLLLLKSWHSWAFAPSCVSVQRALFSRILMWVMSWLPRRLFVWMARACTSHRWNSRLSLISNVRLRWLKLRNPLARRLTLA